jgi:hypothetical protein
MLIEALEIDDAVRAKLHAKHRVIWDEVLAVCFGDAVHVRRGREQAECKGANMAAEVKTALEQEIDRIDAGGETWENSAC